MENELPPNSGTLHLPAVVPLHFIGISYPSLLTVLAIVCVICACESTNKMEKLRINRVLYVLFGKLLQSSYSRRHPKYLLTTTTKAN